MFLCAWNNLIQGRKYFWRLLFGSLILPGGFWLQSAEPLSYIKQSKYQLLHKNTY